MVDQALGGQDVRQAFLVVEPGSDSRRNNGALQGLRSEEQVGVCLC